MKISKQKVNTDKLKPLKNMTNNKTIRWKWILLNSFVSSQCWFSTLILFFFISSSNPDSRIPNIALLKNGISGDFFGNAKPWSVSVVVKHFCPQVTYEAFLLCFSYAHEQKLFQMEQKNSWTQVFTHLHPLMWFFKRFWWRKGFWQNLCHKKTGLLEILLCLKVSLAIERYATCGKFPLAK